MNNNIFQQKTNAIFLAIVLVLGTFAAISPSFMVGTAQADSYLEIENNYEKSYGNYNNIDKSKDSSSVTVKKIKCNNINVNVNGLEFNVTSVPFLNNLLASEAQVADKGERGASSYGSGGNYGGGQSGSEINDFRFICINNNNNTVIGEEAGPTTGSLTIQKQIFGCVDTVPDTVMNCQGLDPDSDQWLSCDDATISGTDFCQNLQENFFDIEVLDDQNNQIQEFQGSQQGTTISNLEPGTYTVNEIKHPDIQLNQLQEDANSEFRCVNIGGFPDGGFLQTAEVQYSDICFEYEDEQGNDCTMTTIAAGEEKTCIVKNYIRLAEERIV